MKPDCDACQGIEPLTPETVANRPGLPALRYRAGTHGSFLSSMIAKLSVFGAERAKAEAERQAPARRSGQPLAPPATWLRSREPSDPTIALLDAWSTVGDILTFYQERIANEGFLSTALERRSLHELASQVGYRLRPALSSSVYLAFDVQAPPALDLDVPPAPPHEVLIPKGTQSRHIPGPGELSQVFETKEDLTGRPEWNLLKPRLTRPVKIEIGGDDHFGKAHELRTLRFDRIDHNLKPGDYLLLVEARFGTGTPPTLILQIAEVEIDRDRKQTVVTLVESNLSLTRYRDAVIDPAQRFADETLNVTLPDEAPDHWQQKLESWRTIASGAGTHVASGKTLLEADDELWKQIAVLSTDQVELDKLNQAYQAATRSPITTIKVDSNSTVLEVTRGIPAEVKKGEDIFTAAETNRGHVHEFLDTLSDSTQNLIEKQLNEANMKSLIDTLTTEKNKVSGSSNVTAALTSCVNSLTTAKDNLNDGTKYTSAIEAALKSCSDGMTAASMKDAVDVFADSKAVEKEINTRKDKITAIETDGTPTDAEKDARAARAGDVADRLADPKDGGFNPRNPLYKNIVEDTAESVKVIRDQQVKEINESVQNAIKALPENMPQKDKDALANLLPANSNTSLSQAVNTVIDTTNNFALRAVATITTGATIQQVYDSLDKLIRSWKGASLPFVKGVVESLQSIKPQLTVSESVKDSPKKTLSDGITAIAKVGTDDSNGPDSRLSKCLLELEKIPNTSTAPGSAADVALVNKTRERINNGIKVMFAASISSTPFTLPDLGNVDTLGGGQLIPGASLNGTLDIQQGGSDFVTRAAAAIGTQATQNAIGFWGHLRNDQARGKVFSFRIRASLFGSQQLGEITILDKDKKPQVVHPAIEKAPDEDVKVLYLDHDYSDITTKSWCLVGTQASLVTREVDACDLIQRNAYLTSGKSMRLTLNDNWRGSDENFEQQLKSTIVLAGSVELPLADDLIETPFPEPANPPTDTAKREKMLSLLGRFVELESFEGALSIGQYLILSGKQVSEVSGDPNGVATGLTSSHLCKIQVAIHAPDPTGTRVETMLEVHPPLTVELARDTVRIYANVVEATNGSTVSEVIGNGEGQGQFQRFLLSQPKLTYLPAETASGMKPEIEVRVNSVAWDLGENVGELQTVVVPARAVGGVPQRTGLPRKYLAAVDDEEKTFLTTGDGMTTGERLPTGITNVRATYRVGGGTGGNVPEGTITQLASPPLNVTKVRNLMRASGGVDRENVEQARKNVPLAVMALDRLVSVVDYESFVRKFAGIAKAQAKVLILNGQNTVVVTIAGLDDIPIDRESLMYRNLVTTVKKYADPEQAVLVEPRELLLLLMQAKIKIEDDRLFEVVKAEVKRRILARFTFEKAELGESVLLSDLIETIQNTPGVRYVDVDMFDRMRQFYGTGDMVRKAACIASAKLPKDRIDCQIARNQDADIDTLLVKNPTSTQGPQKLGHILEANTSFKTDGKHFISAVAVDDPKPSIKIDDNLLTDAIVTLRIFANDTGDRPPPNAQANTPAPFPAQLAYFADLAGTILLKEIK